MDGNIDRLDGISEAQGAESTSPPDPRVEQPRTPPTRGASRKVPLILREVPGIGRVALRPSVSLNTIIEAERQSDLLPAQDRPAAFTNSLIASMLVEPQFGQALASLSDEAVTPLVKIAVNALNIRKAFEDQPSTLPSRERLFNARNAWLRPFSELSDKLKEFSLPIDQLKGAMAGLASPAGLNLDIVHNEYRPGRSSALSSLLARPSWKLPADLPTLATRQGLREYDDAAQRERAERVDGPTFRKKGEYWSIRYRNETFFLRHTKGLAYIAWLLRHPAQEYHALTLVRALEGDARIEEEDTAVRVVQDGLSIRGTTDDLGPALDAAAIAACKERIEDIMIEIEEADRNHDPERVARLREERDRILEQMEKDLGWDRGTRSPEQRARVNLTNQIRTAIKRIAEQDGELGGFLKTHIRTGLFFQYTGETQFSP